MRYLVHHLLADSAGRAGDREALVDGQQRFSYKDFLDRSSALAHGLRDLGIRRGERVGIFLKPHSSLPTAMMGISQADAVFVPIHHGLFPQQVAHILGDCRATALITDTTRWRNLQGTLTDLDQLRFTVVEGEDSQEVSPPCIALQSLCARPIALPHAEESIGKDLAAILYTSGSTGPPKGVMLSHANILAGAEIVAEYLHLNSQDRLLAALPFSFDAGLNQLTSSMLRGCATVLIDFRFGRDIVQALRQEHVTGLAGVPSLWHLLTQPSSGLSQEHAAHLRYVTNTGGAMPPSLLSRLRSLLPKTDVFLMYGLTEAFRSTYLPPAEIDKRPNSIGRAIPNTEILVVNDQGESCAPGEVGELVHHGPTVSLGYWGQPELTDRVLRPHPFNAASRSAGQRVCYSGDLVKMDADGYLYFVERRDNQIKSAGFRISPTEVEEVICQYPAIRQAAVVGATDPALGQHIVAFVIPDQDVEIEPSAIIVHCAGKLPRHMVPKRVKLVGELPKTSSGKTDYPSLRKQLEQLTAPEKPST